MDGKNLTAALNQDLGSNAYMAAYMFIEPDANPEDQYQVYILDYAKEAFYTLFGFYPFMEKLYVFMLPAYLYMSEETSPFRPVIQNLPLTLLSPYRTNRTLMTVGKLFGMDILQDRLYVGKAGLPDRVFSCDRATGSDCKLFHEGHPAFTYTTLRVYHPDKQPAGRQRNECVGRGC